MRDRRITSVHVLLFKVIGIKSLSPFSLEHLSTVANNLQLALFFKVTKPQKYCSGTGEKCIIFNSLFSHPEVEHCTAHWETFQVPILETCFSNISWAGLMHRICSPWLPHSHPSLSPSPSSKQYSRSLPDEDNVFKNHWSGWETPVPTSEDVCKQWTDNPFQTSVQGSRYFQPPFTFLGLCSLWSTAWVAYILMITHF